MDKNVFVAIALSMSVLLFWGAFFETPKNQIEQKTNNQIQEKSENSITPSTNQAPSINQLIVEKKVSRDESINNSDRIRIENENIIGSISLVGGLIDDISFNFLLILFLFTAFPIFFFITKLISKFDLNLGL